VKATVLTSRSVKVTWDPSSLSGVAGYLISYTTTASYTSGGTVTVNGGSTTSGTLTNLEENTVYTVTVKAIKRTSIKSIGVSVTTYTDGKLLSYVCIILMLENIMLYAYKLHSS